MELHITLSEDSLKSLKAAVATEAQQPGLITESCPDLYCEVAARIDYSRLAQEYDPSDIADHIQVADIVSEIDISHIDPADIASNIDLSDLAREIDIDTSEVADHIRISDVAAEIDTYELADRIADKLDYDTIVESVSMNQVALHMVAKFVNNEEFRKAFIDAIFERIAKSVETP
jgi:hypothetical protein